MSISIPGPPPPKDQIADAEAGLFRAYWDASVDGLFTMTVLPTGQFIHENINRALETGTGLQDAQMCGRTPDEALAPLTAAIANERFNACVAAGRPIDFLEVLDLPNGVSVWRGSLVPIRGEGGRIERLLGRMQDDTDAWRSTALVQSLSGLLQDTFASISSPLAVLDRSGQIRVTNAAWRQWRSTRNPDRPLAPGDNIMEFCDRVAGRGLADAAVIRNRLDDLLCGSGYSFSHTYQRGAGVFVFRAARFEHARETWVVVTVDDVTGEHRAREATERLLLVQEEERQRIALELHDSTSQHLVAIQLGLAALGRNPSRADVMQDMRHALGEAQREIRSLSYLLNPAKVAEAGLDITLRRYVDGFRKRTGASVTCELDGPVESLPIEVQHAVFRIIQEAMSNAHRHAAAKRIAIEVTLRKRGLRLIVANDGRRMSTEANSPIGVGIAGMRVRLETVGGVLSVDPMGFGTRVLGLVPEEALSRSGRADPAKPG